MKKRLTVNYWDHFLNDDTTSDYNRLTIDELPLKKELADKYKDCYACLLLEGVAQTVPNF